MIVTFKVDGEVRGQGRPRFSTRNGYAHAYEKAEDKAYKERIREAFLKSCDGWEMVTEKPVRVTVTAWKKIPESWTKAKKQEALNGRRFPAKPDVDNIAKAVMDSLNGVAWKDDYQVTNLNVIRKHGEQDALVVAVISDEVKDG